MPLNNRRNQTNKHIYLMANIVYTFSYGYKFLANSNSCCSSCFNLLLDILDAMGNS